MKDITLRFVLRENLDGSWRLDVESDKFTDHVCFIDATNEEDAQLELAELLGGALQKMAMERAERNQR